MATASPEMLIVVLVGAVIYMMTMVGIKKSALEWKRSNRPCPSCGHSTHDCTCRH